MGFEGGKWEFWAWLLGKVVVDFGMGLDGLEWVRGDGFLSWCVD